MPYNHFLFWFLLYLLNERVLNRSLRNHHCHLDGFGARIGQSTETAMLMRTVGFTGPTFNL